MTNPSYDVLQPFYEEAVELAPEKGLGVREAALEVFGRHRPDFRGDVVNELALRGFLMGVEEYQRVHRSRLVRSGRMQVVGTARRSILSRFSLDVGGIQKYVVNFSVSDVDYIIASYASKEDGIRKQREVWETLREKMVASGKTYITGLPTKDQDELAEALVEGRA